MTTQRIGSISVLRNRPQIDHKMAAVLTPTDTRNYLKNRLRDSSRSVSSTTIQKRAPSAADATVFQRRILFLLDPDTDPVFPFCQAAQNARCRYRWPPWPHRLDAGRRTKVKWGAPFFSPFLPKFKVGNASSTRTG